MLVKNLKFILILILLSLLLPYYVFADIKQAVLPASKVGRQYLVIIAINNYSNWSRLDFPLHYGKNLAEILNEYYYVDETILLLDDLADKKGILNLFQEELKNKLTPEDSIILFYAGHGMIDANSGKDVVEGYWIPFDADKTAKTTWISNQEIKTAVKDWRVKHILLLIDSCFSGSLLSDKSRGSRPIDNPYYQQQYSQSSCLVIASGSQFQYVPDNSEFSLRLVNYLKKNRSSCINDYDIFYHIQSGITQTTPQFGSLKTEIMEWDGSLLLFRKPYTYELTSTQYFISLLSGILLTDLQSSAEISMPVSLLSGYKLLNITSSSPLFFIANVQYQSLLEYHDIYLTLGILTAFYFTRHWSLDFSISPGVLLMGNFTDPLTRNNFKPGVMTAISSSLQITNHMALNFAVSLFPFILKVEYANEEETALKLDWHTIVTLSAGLKFFG